MLLFKLYYANVQPQPYSPRKSDGSFLEEMIGYLRSHSRKGQTYLLREKKTSRQLLLISSVLGSTSSFL